SNPGNRIRKVDIDVGTVRIGESIYVCEVSRHADSSRHLLRHADIDWVRVRILKTIRIHRDIRRRRGEKRSSRLPLKWIGKRRPIDDDRLRLRPLDLTFAGIPAHMV